MNYSIECGKLGTKTLTKPATLATTGSGESKPANDLKAATSSITGFLSSGAVPKHDGWCTASSSEPNCGLIALELSGP